MSQQEGHKGLAFVSEALIQDTLTSVSAPKDVPLQLPSVSRDSVILNMVEQSPEVHPSCLVATDTDRDLSTNHIP